MKLLANKHIFSLIGAVIGVLAGIVFSRALVLILDWNWKTITLINLATYIFIITIFVYLLPLIFTDEVAWPCIASFILLLIILPFLVPGVDFYTILSVMPTSFIIISSFIIVPIYTCRIVLSQSNNYTTNSGSNLYSTCIS